MITYCIKCGEDLVMMDPARALYRCSDCDNAYTEEFLLTHIPPIDPNHNSQIMPPPYDDTGTLWTPGEVEHHTEAMDRLRAALALAEPPVGNRWVGPNQQNTTAHVDMDQIRENMGRQVWTGELTEVTDEPGEDPRMWTAANQEDLEAAGQA